MTNLREGEVYVHGHDKHTAVAVMEACDELEVHQHVVRTTDEGFVMPVEVWELAERTLGWNEDMAL